MTADSKTTSSSSPKPHLPFCVSLVEQTRVDIWKESLLMVQQPKFCMLFPRDACPFSSSSILVAGRPRYVDASSSFFASAFLQKEKQNYYVQFGNEMQTHKYPDKNAVKSLRSKLNTQAVSHKA